MIDNQLKSQDDRQLAHIDRLGNGVLLTKRGCNQTATYTVERYVNGEIKRRDRYLAAEFECNYRWFT